jgi:hypothetical protein
MMRGLAYRLYRRANEEAVVYAAYENLISRRARDGKHQSAGHW